MNYSFADLKNLIPGGGKYGTVTVTLAEGDSCWMATSTKHLHYGPATVITRFNVENIEQAVSA